MLDHSNDECTTTVGPCDIAYWHMQACMSSKTQESISSQCDIEWIRTR